MTQELIVYVCIKYITITTGFQLVEVEYYVGEALPNALVGNTEGPVPIIRLYGTCDDVCNNNQYITTGQQSVDTCTRLLSVYVC